MCIKLVKTDEKSDDLIICLTETAKQGISQRKSIKNKQN